MGGKWGKRADFDLDDWYNKRDPNHKTHVAIEFARNEFAMNNTKEQVKNLVENMMSAFDSLRETLLSMEYQKHIFGKGKKVIGDFDVLMDEEKSKGKPRAQIQGIA